MKNKISIHNFWRSDAFIILMFAMMALISNSVMWFSHSIIISSDLSFHLQRIYEIHDSILNGIIFPNVSLNKFNQTGSSVISLYPNLNIYPIAILSFLVKSFVALYSTFWTLSNFFSLVLSYFACKSYTDDKKVSFIFSVSYTLSTIFLYLKISTMIGETSSIIFLPLVLFGFLNLLRKNVWIELTIGLVSISLIHVLDTLIVAMFLFILILVNCKQMFHKESLILLCKSFVVTLFICSIFWTPLFYMMWNNRIAIPTLPNLSIDGDSLIKLFSTFLFRMGVGLSLCSIIGLILSPFMYKKLSNYCKQLFWIAIFFTFVSSNLFPWMIFHDTIIEKTLQFPDRFIVIPNLLLTYIFSELIINLSSNERNKTCLLICTTIIVVLMQFLGQIKYQYFSTFDRFITGNYEFNNVINSYSKNQYDYYPQNSIKTYQIINQHLATFSRNKHIKMKLLGNGGYEFSNKARIKDLALPFLYYNGINYQVKLDGRTVNGFANKNSLMTIKNVNKGRHHVRIVVHNTKMQIVSYITSLIGLIILLGVLIRKYILRK